jgi:hypothetical protein
LEREVLRVLRMVPPYLDSASGGHEALAAAFASVALGAVLWWLAGAGRWVLDRRGSRAGKRRGPLAARGPSSFL